VAETVDWPVSLTIGTAGHVDHGKTTLVRLLTGTDTDRLEEEHRRGISIVPGYAELELPGGRRASLVDVPGHERFVKNMVAGSTGVDAFLLVVAADDGVMPQTREHLDVLRVLGVEQGVVALTKTDAADEETVELAHLEVEELLESAGIPAPVVHVSGATGRGKGELLRALDALAGSASSQRPSDGLARLPVDRSFVLKGIGVVVTGTLWSGGIRLGDTLHTASGYRPRVRGIQNHGRPAEVAYPGARTALDLSGIEASDIEPGDVLLSRSVPRTRAFDARLRLVESASPLRHNVRARLYHGTRSTNARIRLFDRDELAPGDDALARFTLDEPMVALSGDRFVLRSLSPQVTVGGGTVLDPSPAGRRPDLEWLQALESADMARIVPLALSRSPKDGMTAEELSLAVSVSSEEVRGAIEGAPGVAELGDLFGIRKEIESSRERLIQALRKRGEERPESPALSVAEARIATGLSPRFADALLASMNDLRVTDSGVSLPDANEVPPELEEEAARLRKGLLHAGSEPPATEPTPALRLLLKRREVVELGANLFASGGAAETVLEEIKTVCRKEGGISLSGFRDHLGTSRKYAQAWLEYADTEGVTRRVGDARVLTRRYR